MNFYRTAEGSFISFKWDTLKNNFLSEKEGRPVFDKVLIGTVKSAGQQKSELDIAFIREDIHGNTRRDENAWNKYGAQANEFMKNPNDSKLQGTPIEEFLKNDMKKAASLKALNIFTVEALADLNDVALSSIGMDGRKLQREAKAYVEACKTKEAAHEAIQKYAQENAELKEQVASLTSIVMELKRDKEQTAPKKRASNK